MNKKVRWILVVTSALLIAAIGISGLLSQSDEREGIYKKLDIFVEVMKHIRSDYVEQVHTSSIFDGAIKGMMRGLDAESSYLTSEEHDEYLRDLPQHTALTGIEVIKSPLNGYAQVAFIRPDSPAANSGVVVGDFIRAIDGKSTRDLPIIMIELLMSGPPESIATLSILRTGINRTLSFEVPRTELRAPETDWRTIDGVGYIALKTFKLGTLERVRTACGEFEGMGIKSLIIDLRGNLRGDLNEAVHVADLFAREGILLALKAKDSSIDYTADEVAFDFDLYLLCDETTARAAEAFAVSLADRGAATIVGRTTAGIGTVQKKIELEDGALLIISYARAVGPDGTEINGIGVNPAAEVPKTSGAEEEDAVLNKALELAEASTRDRAAA